jgi:tripartite-type tricarboxylate transporter receptor subunit TctC
MNPSRRWLLMAASVAAWFAAYPATAQPYPSRPVTMIVPASAGGPTDAIARVMSERMTANLGGTVLVDNVAGAGGSIGVGKVARSAADGYTLGIGQWSHYVLNGATYALQYDLLADFAPVALIVTGPMLIVSRKDLPANDMKGLIAWLKANPDKAAAGTGGVGAPGHISGIFFQKLTDTRFQFVPYRGTAPAMQDLLYGQIDLLIDSPITSLPQVRAGKIKAYAVFAKDRYPSAPDIPTVDEAGLPGFHMSVWNALWTVKGTPRDIVAKLNAAAVEALADPAVRKRFAELGQAAPSKDDQTPEALGALQRADIAKWWPVVKAANIKGE